MAGEVILLPPQLQDWKVLGVLRRSNHNTVYKLQHNTGSGEMAALKVISIPQSELEISKLRNNGHDDQSIADIFQRRVAHITDEYAQLRSISGHTGIAHWDNPIYIRRSDGIGWDIYIKSELLESVEQRLPLNAPEDQIVRLGIELCGALSQCQRTHLVHRGIRPQSIYIAPGGKYKLGDFGDATVMEQVAPMATADSHSFTAPEVYNGGSHTPAADLYALGLSMYWLLNERKLPFENQVSGEHAMLRRFNGEALPEPVHGSSELKQIILKACAPSPGDRYASAEEMMNALKELDISTDSDGKPLSEEERRRLQMERDAYILKRKEEEALRKKQERQRQEQEARLKLQQEQEALQKMQEEEARQRKKILITAGSVLALLLLLLIAYFTIHFWGSAPCGKHPVCKLCGREKASVVEHHWIAATCIDAKTCTSCGTVDGDPLGHSCTDATCTSPETCLRCGTAFGVALGHQWIEATTSAPKTCAVCGITEGIPLPTEDPAVEVTTPNTSAGASNDIISLELGLDHTVALFRDGTVCSIGDNSYNQCATSEWTDITQISVYCNHTVALRQDGIVYATGQNNHGQCNVSGWRNITAVAAGRTHTVGLRSDGTVVAVGENRHGECNVSGWTDIVQIYAGWYNTVGMRRDGSILITGLQGSGQSAVTGWTDIQTLSTSDSHIVGLRSNGTVIAVGSNKYNHCEVSGWTNIAEIHAGCAFTLGLRTDGTVVYIGITDENQEMAALWEDIELIGVGFEHIVGIQSDGTIVAVGSNDCGQCDIDPFYEYLNRNAF